MNRLVYISFIIVFMAYQMTDDAQLQHECPLSYASSYYL